MVLVGSSLKSSYSKSSIWMFRRVIDPRNRFVSEIPLEGALQIVFSNDATLLERVTRLC